MARRDEGSTSPINDAEQGVCVEGFGMREFSRRFLPANQVSHHNAQALGLEEHIDSSWNQGRSL